MSVFGSSNSPTRSPATGIPGRAVALTGVCAVVWSRNDDTLLLLRGLLQLHHCSATHSIAGLDEYAELPLAGASVVLIVDAEGREIGWEEELRTWLRDHPEARALVILARDAASADSKARTAGASEVLGRPFVIHDFVSAVASASSARRPG